MPIEWRNGKGPGTMQTHENCEQRDVVLSGDHLLELALQQPGVMELMAVYARFQEVQATTDAYAIATMDVNVMVASNSTEPCSWR